MTTEVHPVPAIPAIPADPFLARSRLPVSVTGATAVLVGAGASLMCVASLGPMAAAMGSASVWIWSATALIGGLQCVLLAELSSRFPERAGGTPHYAYRAWPRGSASLGALSAWCYWFAWTPGIAVNLILAGSYLHRLFLPHIGPLWLALAAGVMLYALAAAGLRPVAIVGTVLAATAVAVVLLIVAAPVMHPATLRWPLTGGLGAGSDGGAGHRVALVAKWAFVASWSSYAAETASTVGAEVRRARAAMGQVMMTSGLICLATCTVVPVVLFAVAPHKVAADPLEAFIAVVHGALGPAAPAVMGTGLIAVMVLGALAFITSSSRTIYQLAEDGQLPRLFAHVNRRGAPTGSILLDALVITTMLAVFGTNVVDVVAAANVGYLIVFILLPLAYLSLRRVPDVGGGVRLGRWAVALAAGLALVNLALLCFGGAQWGWSVMGVGLAISLLILPVAALCRRSVGRRTQAGD